MKPKHVKKLLLTEIKNVANNSQDYCFNPDSDVRFLISENSYETIVTNLDRTNYSAAELKKLYASRWGIMWISA